MIMKPAKVSIFDFDDYRDFLKAWYQQEKNRLGIVSFRLLSMRAGFTSPNFFKLVMDGARNLADTSINKFLIAIRLGDKVEEEYFRNLVFYVQATNDTKKEYHLERLNQLKQYRTLKALLQDQYEYFSGWYHPVIRELLIAKECKSSVQWIKKRLFFSIEEATIEQSIELLQRMGFVKKGKKKGTWVQAEPLITTGDEVYSEILMNYHKNLLQLISQNIAHIPRERRDISALTLGVSKKTASKLKKKIQDFRKEILKLVSLENDPEEVVLLSMQLLPFTNE